jgi:hypothetical protein
MFMGLLQPLFVLGVIVGGMIFYTLGTIGR